MDSYLSYHELPHAALAIIGIVCKVQDLTQPELEKWELLFDNFKGILRVNVIII